MGSAPSAYCAESSVKRACGIAFHDHFEKVHDATTICKAKHGADLIGRCFSCAMADGLIKQRRCIARGAFGGAGDEGEGVIGYFGLLTVSDTAEHGDHVFGFDATQVKALATGKHGHREPCEFPWLRR